MIFDAYFLPPKPAKPVPRKEFSREGIPIVLGNGWVEFVISDYATLEKRTRCEGISIGYSCNCMDYGVERCPRAKQWIAYFKLIKEEGEK